jgi:hypothetical protein
MPDSVEDALVCACMCTLRAPARAQPTPREEESRKLAAQLLLPRMKRWLRAGAGASRKRVGAVVRLVAVQGGRAGRGCALQLMLSLLEHLRSADSGADSMRLSSARAARVELFSLWLSICTPGWATGGGSEGATDTAPGAEEFEASLGCLLHCLFGQGGELQITSLARVAPVLLAELQQHAPLDAPLRALVLRIWSLRLCSAYMTAVRPMEAVAGPSELTARSLSVPGDHAVDTLPFDKGAISAHWQRRLFASYSESSSFAVRELLFGMLFRACVRCAPADTVCSLAGQEPGRLVGTLRWLRQSGLAQNLARQVHLLEPRALAATLKDCAGAHPLCEGASHGLARATLARWHSMLPHGDLCCAADAVDSTPRKACVQLARTALLSCAGGQGRANSAAEAARDDLEVSRQVLGSVTANPTRSLTPRAPLCTALALEAARIVHRLHVSDDRGTTTAARASTGITRVCSAVADFPPDLTPSCAARAHQGACWCAW